MLKSSIRYDSNSIVTILNNQFGFGGLISIQLLPFGQKKNKKNKWHLTLYLPHPMKTHAKSIVRTRKRVNNAWK